MRAAVVATIVALAVAVSVVVLREVDPVPGDPAPSVPSSTPTRADPPTGPVPTRPGAADPIPAAAAAAAADAADGERADPAGLAGWSGDPADVIDVEGDVEQGVRDWFDRLAVEHAAEQPDEPWVVHWALVVAGEPVVDPEEVAGAAAVALADPQGWALDGAIRWARVAAVEDADVRLVVAAADEVPRYADTCLPWRTGVPDASCTVGDDVVINDRRWRDGALGDAVPLDVFRTAELNHEVGHWLGQGHFTCTDGIAPVNQQQFRSLTGCRANAWPRPWERAMVAARFGLWPSVGQFEPYDELDALALAAAEQHE